MKKHILKRLGVFIIWFTITIIIVYVKNNSSKDFLEIVFQCIFPIFFLILISSFFLLYEASELKKQGNLQFYKANKYLGLSLLLILLLVAFVFIRGVAIIF